MPRTNLPHLAQRLFNTPLAITPGKIEIIMAALADRFGIARIFGADGQAIEPRAWYGDDDGPSGPPPEMQDSEIAYGVQVIRVEGTLVARNGTLQPYSGMTGYDGIRANLMTGLYDDNIRAVILKIDSNGGEVAGCFDLVDTIFNARGAKPIWAILDESAYSAAYALASACDRVIVPRTGGTGSVGVICAHVDFSKALSEAGIDVTLITYGAQKADGNPYQPLGKGALARFQADVNTMGDLFCDTVARNRGMKTSKVRATEAGTFMGGLGVELGFADAVMAPDEAFRSLLDELG